MKHTPNHQIRTRPGFALIATISVMVLLVMVALAMLALSTLEMRSVGNDHAHAEARANARMALMLALGELQKTAGPDQRITANSSVLGLSGSQQQMLGVWKSIGADRSNSTGLGALTSAYKDSYAGKERDGRFLRWLVSGNTSQVSDMALPQSLASQSGTGGTVALVGARTLGFDTDAGLTPAQRQMLVPAPLVQNMDPQQPSRSASAFAWMISGENLKARVDFDHQEPADRAQQLAARAASPGNNIKAIKPGSTAGAPDLSIRFTGQDGKLSTTLRKAVTWGSLPLSATQPTASRQLGYYYHDLTTSSQGLLTNSKWGGLRKDLSMLTEREELPAAMQLSAARSAHIFDDGPFWQDLRTYMRSYKSFDDGGLIEWRGNVPHYTLGPTWLEAARRRAWQHRMPVVTKFLWVVSYFGKPVSASESEMCMIVQPIIEMWNPFNVPLLMPSNSLFDMKLWFMPTNLFVKVAGGGTVLENRCITSPVNENSAHGGRGEAGASVRYQLDFKDQSGNPVAMQPGEVILFSDGSDRPHLPDAKVIRLSKGLEIRGGTYSAELGHYSSKLTLPRSSSVEVFYGPRNIEFYVDNWFVAEGPMFEKWAYHSDIITMRSAGSVSSYFKPNNSYFSLAGTSIDNPQPSLVIGAVLRTEHPIPDPANKTERTWSERSRFSPWLFSANTLGQSSIRDNNPSMLETSPYVYFARRVTDFDDVHVALENDNGHFGRAHGAEGQTHLPVRELPVQPLTSLAQLQHAGLGHYAAKHDHNPQTVAEISDKSDAPDTQKLKPWQLRSHPNINMAFGNSFASPFVPQEGVETDGISPLGIGFDGWSTGPGTIQATLHDKSWKLNEVLWDDWFVSGVGDWTNPLVVQKRSHDDVVADLADGSKPLPNHRYQSITRDPGKALTELRSPDGYQKIAGYLTNKGAFNVNSTSKHAWKAVLGGMDLSTRALPYLDETSLTWENESSSAGYAFSRFTLSNGDSAETSGAGINYWRKRWLGARKLTDDELDALATAIVEQVKLRGPFLSLSEFVNRRLAADDTGLEGALQAAIENAGINAGFENDSVPLDGSQLYGNYANPQAADGCTGKGAPGYLTQADLLMSVAPALTVRCDTFTIRSYGEAHDKNGNVTARAWCEATVQRMPDYVDPSDSPSTEIATSPGGAATALTPINAAFGRRFNITSFRWLSPDEI